MRGSDEDKKGFELMLKMILKNKRRVRDFALFSLNSSLKISYRGTTLRTTQLKLDLQVIQLYNNDSKAQMTLLTVNLATSLVKLNAAAIIVGYNLLIQTYHDKVRHSNRRHRLLRLCHRLPRRRHPYSSIHPGDENFTKSFLRIIDNDDDGIITLKEMKEFTPCPAYDGKKLQKEFREYGRRADLNDLSDFLTVKSGNDPMI